MCCVNSQEGVFFSPSHAKLSDMDTQSAPGFPEEERERERERESVSGKEWENPRS